MAIITGKSFWLVFCCFLSLVQSELFQEELNIRQLPNHQWMGNFRFRILTQPAEFHYNLFPKIIGELVNDYQLDEFHLTLTQGFWRSSLWGFSPKPSAPSGAQLWAKFHTADDRVDSTWGHFIHALSGLFCASLTQIDPLLTVRPEFSFQPESTVTSSSDESVKLSNETHQHSVRYGALASENVCTENLTPWKKLLPAKMEAGISILLNPLRIYDNHYHSMALDFQKICVDPRNCQDSANLRWELVLSLTVVSDSAAAGSRRDWSLLSRFGSQILRPALMASSSKINVDITDSPHLSFSPPSEEVVVTKEGRKFVQFDVLAFFLNGTGRALNLAVKHPAGPVTYTTIPLPPVHLHSYIAGSGLQSGQIVSQITNSLPSESLNVVYAHVIPWFLRIYYHTVLVKCRPLNDLSSFAVVEPLFSIIRPGKIRQRASYIEVAFRLPKSSRCRLEIEFDRTILRWTEYPPDAHHGFTLPAASLSFVAPNANNQSLWLGPYGTLEEKLLADHKTSGTQSDSHCFTRIYGETLLVNLPTPDFSMPYNVICLVCTVVALAFGPIHTLTTKPLRVVPLNEPSDGLLQRVFTAIKSKLRRQKAPADEKKDL